MRFDDTVLTARRRLVLQLLCQGATDREIAGRLATSERTIQRELGVLRHSLGESSRTRLAVAALEAGLDQPSLSGTP